MKLKEFKEKIEKLGIKIDDNENLGALNFNWKKDKFEVEVLLKYVNKPINIRSQFKNAFESNKKFAIIRIINENDKNRITTTGFDDNNYFFEGVFLTFKHVIGMNIEKDAEEIRKRAK